MTRQLLCPPTARPANSIARLQHMRQSIHRLPSPRRPATGYRSFRCFSPLCTYLATPESRPATRPLCVTLCKHHPNGKILISGPKWPHRGNMHSDWTMHINSSNMAAFVQRRSSSQHNEAATSAGQAYLVDDPPITHQKTCEASALAWCWDARSCRSIEG